METAKAKWYGPKYLVVMIFTALTMALVSLTVSGMTNTVIPLVSEARGWNPQPLYTVVGVAAILDGLLIFFFAKYARKSATKLCGIALLISAVCCVVFALTDNQTLAVVVCTIMGICGCAYCTTGAFVLTANWWPTKKGIVLGWTTMGYVVVNIIWTPRVPAYYAALGITGTHLVVAALVAFCGVIFLVVIKDTPEAAGVTPDGLQGASLEHAKEITKALAEYKSPFTAGKLLKDKNIWILSLAVGLPLTVAFMYLYSMFAATMSAGYSMATCGLVMTVGGFVSLFGSWFFGLIDQKVGTKLANAISCVCIIIAIICCLCIKMNVAFVWIAGMVLFCSNGAGRNLLTSYVGTMYGRWDYAAAYQVIGTISCIVAGIGTFAPAWFTNFTVMYVVCLVLGIVAFICNLLVKDKFVGKPD